VIRSIRGFTAAAHGMEPRAIMAAGTPPPAHPRAPQS
jgi:hypothetical protein